MSREEEIYVIETEKLEKSYGHINALHDVSIRIREGKITAFIGDNGSGKSTLINILSGSLQADCGSITAFGQNLSGNNAKKAISLGINAVYQDLSLDNDKNSFENVFLGDEITKGVFLDRKAMHEETDEILNRLKVRIYDLYEPVRNLSGGQRQALAIARALKNDGKILLLDEPTAAMGVQETHKTLGMFRRLKEDGMTLVLVSHNLQQVFEISDYIYIFRNGNCVLGVETSKTSIENINTFLISGLFPEEDCTGECKDDHTCKTEETIIRETETIDNVKDISRAGRWFRDNSIAFMLVGLCFVVMGFLSVKTNSFFSLKNIVNILEATSFRMILALGMMCVISAGAIDLSVGSVLSLSAILMASCIRAGSSVGAAIAIALLSGIVMGGISGLLVHILRINALIITLGTSFMYRGISLIITLGTPVSGLPETLRKIGCGDIFMMEAGVTYAFVMILLSIPLLYFMKWGHYLRSIGSNSKALLRTGISIGRLRVSAFMVSGLLSAIAGIIIASRLNSAEPNAGLNMEMDAICAVVMGGTALHGGTALLPGTCVAVFLLGLIRNGLTILSVSSYYQQFITGALLLIAVAVSEIRDRKIKGNKSRKL